MPRNTSQPSVDEPHLAQSFDVLDSLGDGVIHFGLGGKTSDTKAVKEISSVQWINVDDVLPDR